MASSSTGQIAASNAAPRSGSTFCYWIKRWRSYQGVTQRRFVELWGVSASLMQKIEADDYSVSQLSFERLETLRTMLGLPSATFTASSPRIRTPRLKVPTLTVPTVNKCRCGGSSPVFPPWRCPGRC